MLWSAFTLIVLLLAVFVVLSYRRQWQWTGLTEIRRPADADEVVRPAKTVWDWLQLFVIPLALAGLAFLLNNAQSNRELARSEAQARREQRHADELAEQQRAVAQDAAREETLRAYLAQMSSLVLDRKLLRSKSGADVRAVARTATLTAVRRLNGERRGLVVRFLTEARLLGPAEAKVELLGADLRAAHAPSAHLDGAHLEGANLDGANLNAAHSSGGHLSRAS